MGIICLNRIQETVLALCDYIKVQAYACNGRTDVSWDAQTLQKGVHVVVRIPDRNLDIIKCYPYSTYQGVRLDGADEILSRGFKD
ncbi:uncharacterized protein VTP21DRAFT_4142 [Calcarisporiella thermophila]|uniref:uncharacterized protein n=1 Tax=Calcarisporiella thermophila TaxID=911321 RepID=UPI003743FA58